MRKTKESHTFKAMNDPAETEKKSVGRRIIRFFVCFLLVFAFPLSLWKQVKVSHYSVNGFPCKLLLLADIHDSRVDTNIIAEERPDIIAIAGDIINADTVDLSPAKKLLEALVRIAPTYVSFGNHELAYAERTGIDLASVFQETGAVVLDKAYVDTVIQGQPIRIGGIYGYCLPEWYGRGNQDELSFLREFEHTDSYKILLDHLPYSWSHYGIAADYEIDLVVSGHTHGGQVILPFVGAVYEQEFGFFPGKVSGQFIYSGTNVIVSAGLGGLTNGIPGINNPPELPVVTAREK